MMFFWGESNFYLKTYLIAVCAATLSSSVFSIHAASNVQLQESFDGAELTALGRQLIAHDKIELLPSVGVNDSKAIKVTYEGYEKGSHRVTSRIDLEASEEYLLSFSVKFCEGFDFAKGGKLHGLASAFPAYGGNSVEPDAWSARLMFRRDGGLMSYIYHQNMKGRYGDVEVAPDFNFKPGHYYNVELYVKLNSPETTHNGLVRVSVNDKELLVHDGIQFRSEDNENSKISKFMFSTFHGGSSERWAPRHSDGSFSEECAYFDNFTIVAL